MTEMVYGAVPLRDSEPILPRWWRTIDRWTLSAVLLLFGIGILLGLAASPPLASRNGFEPFHYVQRQAFFGMLALTAMILTSMMSPQLVRRLGVLGFFCAFAALVMLPIFGTDFGKGATRWYSLGFASVQPSEFLKPGLIIMSAWLMGMPQRSLRQPGVCMIRLRIIPCIIRTRIADFHPRPPSTKPPGRVASMAKLAVSLKRRDVPDSSAPVKTKGLTMAELL